jgi:hypothetical protein
MVLRMLRLMGGEKIRSCSSNLEHLVSNEKRGLIKIHEMG